MRGRPGWGRLVRGLRRTAVALLVLVVGIVALAALVLVGDRLDPVRPDVVIPGSTVLAAGVATHVEHWPAARPTGLPPLVLVPGFAESTYVFSRLAPRLAAERDVWAYDVRGWGFTAHVPPYDLAADTDQLAGLITALGLVRPVVVGHSSGVAIALSLALRDPAAVTGVVAANGDGTPYLGSDRSAPAGGGVVPTLLALPPVGPAVVTLLVRARGPARSLVGSRCGSGCPVDDAAIDRWRAPFLADGGVTALLAVVRRPLIGLTDDEERAVRVPVAVLYSGADDTFDEASARATAARLHATLITGLPGAQHLALLGEPDRFAGALVPQLDALSRCAGRSGAGCG